MARYIGPKTRISRRFGEPIFGEDKNLERRNFPPGQHGLKKKRAKKSEYAGQLDEKQKAKFTYGILERQFRRMFEKSSRSKGITGEVLLQTCERRLDNVVYRLGLSSTRAGARQLVSHKHILVNGKVSNVPSMLLKAGDEVSVREKSKNMHSIEAALTMKKDYEWLSFNQDTMVGKFIIVPERQLIPENINEQLIVELYSK